MASSESPVCEIAATESTSLDMKLLESQDQAVVTETKDATGEASESADALAAGDTAADGGSACSKDITAVAEAGDAASGGDAASNTERGENVLGYDKDEFPHVKDNGAESANNLLAQGKAYFQDNNYEQAISCLQSSIEIQRTSNHGDTKSVVETHYYLGLSLKATNKLDESAEAFDLGKTVANNILAAKGIVNGTDTDDTIENADIDAVKTLLQNIMSNIDSVKSELGAIPAAEPFEEQEAVVAQEPSKGVELENELSTAKSSEVVQESDREPAVEPAVAIDTEPAVALDDGAVVATDSEPAVAMEAESAVATDAEPAVTAGDEADQKGDDSVQNNDDATAVASNIMNGACNKRPVEDDAAKDVKKAKLDGDETENAENNIDGSVSVNADESGKDVGSS